MIKSTSNKGFQLTFENGWTISVQFGYGNYCENNHHPEGWNFSEQKEIVECKSAEIAIWDSGDNWYNFGGDTVKGWCPANEVSEWIYKVSQFNNK